VTRQEFILATLTSILGAIVYDLSRKGLVYLRSKKFRKARRRFVRTAPAQIGNVLAPVYPVIPLIGRHPFVTMTILWISCSVVFINFNTMDPQIVSSRFLLPSDLLGGPLSLF
jgi:hypothetical protein